MTNKVETIHNAILKCFMIFTYLSSYRKSLKLLSWADVSPGMEFRQFLENKK